MMVAPPPEGKKGIGREAPLNRLRPEGWWDLTTGTWPSPFFLLWVDSIWRGGLDVGGLDFPELDNLTSRQKWIVWREWEAEPSRYISWSIRLAWPLALYWLSPLRRFGASLLL